MAASEYAYMRSLHTWMVEILAKSDKPSCREDVIMDPFEVCPWLKGKFETRIRAVRVLRLRLSEVLRLKDWNRIPVECTGFAGVESYKYPVQ